MDYFNYQNETLHAENVPVSTLAEKYGTPCYIYSRATLERHWQAYETAFKDYPHLICYAVKANSNIAILNLLAKLGSGFDIVSQGELERVLAAGGTPEKIIFSGVGKTITEIKRALEIGINCFDVESLAELNRINRIAGELGCQAPITLRINPNINAQTHPYIATGLNENKFGIPYNEALEAYTHAAELPNLKLKGLACHIGSQIITLSPFLETLDSILLLANQLEEKGIKLSHLNLGGGLGVCYADETPPQPAEYIQAIKQKLANKPYQVILEPGRTITANAGILLTKVEYLKHTTNKNFAIVDAAMTELLRPALYQAHHQIIPVQPSPTEKLFYDIVGPVCETSDYLGHNYQLALKQDDLLAIRTAGAYGFSMSSNYNSRPRVAEVLVDGNKTHLIRKRETYAELFSGEMIASLS